MDIVHVFVVLADRLLSFHVYQFLMSFNSASLVILSLSILHEKLSIARKMVKYLKKKKNLYVNQIWKWKSRRDRRYQLQMFCMAN